MAWQASGAWKKSLPKDSSNDDSSFPGLKPTTPDATTKIEYEELQQNELLALEAIYGDDFVKHNDTHSAWKKTELSFDIRIKASTDSDFAVTVGFVMTATYPKSPPLLTVKDLDSLRESTQYKIQKFVDTEPREFAKDEQEMVDRIVEGIRDILEDAAQVKASGKQLPSLEEERERHEAKLAEKALQQKEDEARKKIEETKEEERVMSEMLQQQIDRQRQKAKESRLSRRPNGVGATPSDNSATSIEKIEFDQFCHMKNKEGNNLSFKAVTGKCDPREGQVTVVYTVRPVLANGQGDQTLALKEAILRPNNRDPKEFKKQLQSVESRLQELKNTKAIHHRRLVDILDFKVESGKSSDGGGVPTNFWTVRILMPMAAKGSLEELLELAGHLELGKVRSWTRDLLDALTFLHSKNIAHQDIHASNVLLFRESTGEFVPKLSDCWFQREIHNASTPKPGLPGLTTAKSAYWLPPEIAGQSKPQYTYKTDVWEFGIVFTQMIFGLDVLQKYSSPRNLIQELRLTVPLEELVSRFFKEDKQKRPRPFELGSSEFLATDAPVFAESDDSRALSTTPSLTSLHVVPARLRRDSMSRGAAVSRYTEDFVEEGRLGKGGFGEVVKARKKLDGQIYAIKKVTQRSHVSLTDILKEVRMLSQLSHPAVVRYYNTWVEEVPDTTDTEGETSTEGYTEETEQTASDGIDIQFATSTGGLDFMSSNAAIEFGYDDDSDDNAIDDDDSEDDNDDDSSIVGDSAGHRVVIPDRERAAQVLRRARQQRAFRTILYISMEYCEKRTLRDLISRNLYKTTPEIWRLFRQILEGMSHIHSLGIVHRDLKPENIFISSSHEGVDNVKIGDFGLATTGQFSVDKVAANSLENDGMTRSIGTAYYSAPEVRSAGNGLYSSKVDMYSLGIIFFEMCYHPMVGMEKADVIGKLRRPKPELPSDFKPAERSQTEIVLSLVNHNPKERPSCADLLKSGTLPVQMESETIRRTLAGLSDPSSPYYTKMLSTLFARPRDAAKDYAWDLLGPHPGPNELLNQGVVRSTLVSIFRRHGAVEVSRTSIYPRSNQYGENVVQVLDPNGMVLQLPFDLTMGGARMIAKQSVGPVLQRSFCFGNVYRDRLDTGQPYVFGEVDFDIVTTDTLDLALKEAEVLKVIDEIVQTFPSLSGGQMCFHVGHSDLLQLIFDHCGVEQSCRRQAAEALSRLHIYGHTWQKVRAELRSTTVGVSATSVDELQRFDFRDTPNKALSKLKALFEGSELYQRAVPTMAHLKEVAEYCKRFGVLTKFYVNPLNSLRENFFMGGVMFSCVYDRKTRDVFAAGGRYDHLIKENRPKIGGSFEERHAVGFSLAWERLARVPNKSASKTFLKKQESDPNMMFTGKRCDVLVASFDKAILRSTGIEILQLLWDHDISAEMAKDARSPEDLLSKHRDENYSWIIVVKPESILKVKTMGRKDVQDVDLQLPQLMAWLRAELKERDSRTLAKLRGTASHGAGETTGTHHTDRNQDQDVKVLVAGTKSKKFNRRTVVDQAQASASNLMRSYLDGPILAIETTDQVMDLLRETKLSDHESWKSVEHAVTMVERRYVRELQTQLDTWRSTYERKNTSKHAFLYNFRTGTCVYYDLSA